MAFTPPGGGTSMRVLQSSRYPGAAPWYFWVPGAIILLLVLSAIAVIALPELASPSSFLSTASDPQVIEALLITFVAAANAVLLLALTGIPLAYALARTGSRWKGVIESIVDIPLILPHTVAGLMVYFLFMARGPIGSPLSHIGIFFEEAYPGIVVAMTFVSIPYFVNPVREGFEKVPLHLENVSRTLGASPFRAFWHISLPLTVRPILYGALLAWGRGIGEFAAVVMIAYFPMVISTLIFFRFNTGGLSDSRSIAFFMILVCGVIFLVFRILTRKKGVYDDRA